MTVIGLLCYKISPNTTDIAVLCNSIIGHNDSKNGPYSIGDGKVLCLDVGGSCGFNSPLGTYRKKQTSSKLFFIMGEHQFLREVSEIELFEATITRIKMGYGEVFIELPIPQKPISRRERQLEILESELAEESPITRSPTPCDSVPTRSPTPYDSPPIRLETPIDSTPTGTPNPRQP